ncbi:response regulator transcription factor [Lysobacter niastensis]|uniref:Response regulator transcription factor n=1 Tax=Lysobacter niastensis TaxID=380629 RepID=A0ABS0BB68_9GAMM|nr:response regulator transcription factor [Lysobacter niastensis]MBF6024919.1 response regulator transcription factor [Lysobacter niastensis]
MRILIVDDDVELVGLLCFALDAAGYDVVTAYDGNQAIQRMHERRPELVILDVNLPMRDGFEVLAEIRRTSQVPVMMLTVRTTEEDEVRGLDLGADDYLRKPFSPRALLARVRSLLRRGTDSTGDTILTWGPLSIDMDRSQATLKQGQVVSLSPLELRLLRHLLEHRGRPVDADRLIGLVWGDRDSADRESLKQVVHRLRRKLTHAGGEPTWIEYIPNAGYAFTAPTNS